MLLRDVPKCSACHHLIDLIARGSKQTDESICLSEVELLDFNEGGWYILQAVHSLYKSKESWLVNQGKVPEKFPKTKKGR